MGTVTPISHARSYHPPQKATTDLVREAADKVRSTTDMASKIPGVTSLVPGGKTTLQIVDQVALLAKGGAGAVNAAGGMASNVIGRNVNETAAAHGRFIGSSRDVASAANNLGQLLELAA
ncbi:MAG TPA: hypothetical protein V6C96_03480 [Vampirovibrionales bacterium]